MGWEGSQSIERKYTFVARPLRSFPYLLELTRPPGTVSKAIRMAEEKVKWDKWNTFAETLEKSRTGGGVLGLCIAQSWSPPAMFVAKQMELHRKQKIPIFPIFQINHDEESALTHQYGVVTTPTCIFFSSGKMVTIRRPGYNDDIRFVGTASRENIATLLTSIKAVERDEDNMVTLDF